MTINEELTGERDRLLQLNEAKLLAECRCDTMRGTGPGGQKRNKTESAVRITHIKTNIVAFDDEQRSQHINRHRALQKLRLQIALELRQPPTTWTMPVPSVKSENFVLWAAVALDAMHSEDYGVAAAAKLLGTTTSQLVKNLAKSPKLWQFVNAQRTARNLQPLVQK